MIKNIDSKHINKLVTPSVLPTLEPLLKKHVDAGAILVKVVDETIFSTEESKLFYINTATRRPQGNEWTAIVYLAFQ